MINEATPACTVISHFLKNFTQIVPMCAQFDMLWVYINKI